MDSWISLDAASDQLSLPEHRVLELVEKSRFRSKVENGRVYISRFDLQRFEDETSDALLERLDAAEDKRARQVITDLGREERRFAMKAQMLYLAFVLVLGPLLAYFLVR